jgi:type II secretion system protein N
VTSEAAVGGFERLTGGARALVAGLGSGVAGRRGPLLWYGLYTCALFVVCFAATFPHDLVLQRALTAATAGMPVRIDAGGGSLGWTLAYGIDSLRVRARNGEGEPFLLAEGLRVAPSRFGLLRGNPYPVGIDAALYGGALRGVVDPRPAHFAVNATLEGVDLARYTGLRPWVDGSIRGRLDGAVALDGGGRGPAAATGTVRLRIAGLTLEGAKIRGITAPDLHFNDVHVNGTVKNGRLEVEEMAADGQEIGLRGEGNVLLREPLASSVLALDLTVTPAAAASDGLKMMINMLPGSSGEGGARRVAVGGTLGRPTTR